MPVGVPKAPYRLPGESHPSWIDLYNRLYRERILFLCSPLDDELANQLVSIILYLDVEDSNKRHYMYINSPGGSVLAGVSVFDAINYVKAGTTTICVGMAASMASFVLAGGEQGSRIALPHTRMMIHQPLSGTDGQAGDISTDMAQVLKCRQLICKIYAERTKQPIATIARDLDRDLFSSATEAKKLWSCRPGC
jgi:ATP-dependent Clp protease protease subunit